MKLFYLLVFALLLQSTSLFSQEFIIGVNGGLNNNAIGDINSRGGSIAAGQPDEVFSPNKEIGYQLGGYFMAEFGKFFIRPELNYVSLKNNYDWPTKQAKWKSSKIEFPILLGVEIFDPVSIYAGPSFNFHDETILDGVQVTSFSDGGPDLEDKTISLNFGIMMRYNRFGIDLRYEMANKETEEELLDINRSAYGVNLADLRSYKPNMLRLSVSIDIFRTDGTSLADLFKSDKNCGCPY
ncbi:outer membrane beta-barrel protein [Seonamhaeicola maritimus]|uniref:PorT family protein n=1 Tax=Seonamhaeicola maritimus TaxID=2591822 RepID=A0A5C7GG99_9FLAO|nr:outer membrane beta-barrel protein [Seonamhaeicola maritimus]TXG35681.1 PorT family protein [Seonamhaeicola maritimus]